MSFVSFLFIVNIYVVTRNSLLSSLPSFDVVHETVWEGMARREERRRFLERAGCEGEFCVFSIYCAHLRGYSQLTPVAPPVFRRGPRDGPGGHGTQGREEEALGKSRVRR